MAALNILYLGEGGKHTTATHRADALRRLNCQVEQVDPFDIVRRNLSGRVANAFHFRTGYRLLQQSILDRLTEYLHSRPDTQLVWVDSGELIGRQLLELFGMRRIYCVLFNHDDPTGQRDGRRFDTLKQALPLYDITVAVRDESLIEYQRLGAKKVIRTWRTYDEVAHRPIENVDDMPAKFLSEVAFIGTWMPSENRDRFLLALVQQGISVSIWGARWERSPLWRHLRRCWRGSSLGGMDYVAAIQGAKICLGLLSKQNRDLHTTRSMEIPYAGGLLCAERTVEHLQLYDEDVEAVFWSDVDECVEKCKWLLGDDAAREAIRVAGMKRVRQNKVGNEDLCRRVLESIGFSAMGSDDREALPQAPGVATTKSGS